MLDIMVKVTFKIYVGQQMILPFFINFVNIFQSLNQARKS